MSKEREGERERERVREIVKERELIVPSKSVPFDPLKGVFLPPTGGHPPLSDANII